MLLTSRMIQAINFATDAHKMQKRKGQDIPYIVHPFGVALILARYADYSDSQERKKENIIIAGLLHDVIEDTPITKKDIERAFPKLTLEEPTVADLVTWESEPDKSLPWAERKKAALNQLRRAPIEAKYIKAADAIYNMRDMIEGVKRDGDAFWLNFKKGKSDQIARYAALVGVLRNVSFQGDWWGLLEELEDTFDELAQLF